MASIYWNAVEGERDFAMRIIPREARTVVHGYSGALVTVRCCAGSEVGCQIHIGTLRPTRPVREGAQVEIRIVPAPNRVLYAIEWWTMKHE
jgi:hypothetical protein